MEARRPVLVVAAAAVAGLAACGAQATGTISATTAVVRPAAVAAASAPPSVNVVAVGDLACAPGQSATAYGCQQAATARLATRMRPVAALLPGDLQYEAAAAKEWASFDASWGKVPFRLRPAPGNHEYVTPGASGYYDYFGPRAGPSRRGWYAFDLGRWRAYSLNSNCDDVGCEAGSAQERWLAADLAAHPRRCVLAFWHHPRFSSGLHGDSPEMAPIWATLQKARADLVLEGHDHDYERFGRRSSDGAVDPAGIASVVVGTGGKSTYPAFRREPGSRRLVQFRFGVLGLSLSGTGWSWRFRTIDGALRDTGSARCR